MWKANISDCYVFGVNVRLGKKSLLPEIISVLTKRMKISATLILKHNKHFLCIYFLAHWNT